MFKTKNILVFCLTLSFLLLILISSSLISTSNAKPKYGIGDNSYAMFHDPRHSVLETKISRKLVPWSWYTNTTQVADLDLWINTAQSRGVSPLVSFGALDTPNPHYAPSKKEFEQMINTFIARYPNVVDISPWNEANHSHQPTDNKPKLAAIYYNSTVRACKKAKRKCRIVGADILGQPNMNKWVKKFLKHAKPRPKIWGFHNYSDVNRFRKWGKTDTKKFLKLVRGEVWLTEVGGFYAFKNSFKPDVNRNANATKQIIKIANKNKRIKRVYFYSWFGTHNNNVAPYLWDSAFINPNGSPRPSYDVLRRALGK